ncbi:MAG TPA: beta galactosidase jelly roll domain-containing protein, partial [Armatimonadota bacterium]|nr:beta galactosidase jelly roll domain-containing protein [Armatimonadota bacterium]
MRIPVDLTGTWDFIADLDPTYHARHGGFHRPDANRRHWQPVPVPGVWQLYGERYAIFEGVCWFAREFTAPDVPADSRAELRFGAVNYLAHVYLNGEHVGSHEGGYTAFALDVTGKVRPGVNHLAVQVDNRATTIKWPPCLGYFNYGGIHRAVCLDIIVGMSLAEVALTAVPDEHGWVLAVTGRVSAPHPGSIIRISKGDGLSWEACIGADGAVAARVPVRETPAWSPEQPHLEPVAVELLNAD